jgi:hypothetical protein
MKHSIRFIQFKYSYTGKHGQRIIILRGMELRDYPYSDKNAYKLNLLTYDWEAKFYPSRIELTRIYPK